MSLILLLIVAVLSLFPRCCSAVIIPPFCSAVFWLFGLRPEAENIRIFNEVIRMAGSPEFGSKNTVPARQHRIAPLASGGAGDKVRRCLVEECRPA